MAEKEKRRSTTFVTSRGAIINVAAPSIYIAPGVGPDDVTSPTELGEVLREELVPSILPSLKDLGIISTRGARYQGNPVLTKGGAGEWDERLAIDAWVIYSPRYRLWKLWYTGKSGPPIHERIGYATSPDGIVWTKFPANPVLNIGAAGSWEAGDVEEPMVLEINPRDYRMIYQGRAGVHPNLTSQFGAATSIDGVNWTKYAGNPVITAPTGYYWDSRALYRDKNGRFHIIATYGPLQDPHYTDPYRWVAKHLWSDDFFKWTIDPEEISLGNLLRGGSRQRTDDYHIVQFGEICLLFCASYVYGADAAPLRPSQCIDVYIGSWPRWNYVGTCVYPYEDVAIDAPQYSYHEPCAVVGPQDDWRLYFTGYFAGIPEVTGFAYLMLHSKRDYPVVVQSTIAANTTTPLTSCTEIPCEDLKTLALTVECSYHAAAILGIRVDVYGSADGINYDTDVLTSITPSFTAGTTVRKTEYINPNARFLKARVVNLSLAQIVTNVKVTAVVG